MADAPGQADPPDADVLGRVRAFCLSLPGVTERPSHGAPTFFVKRSFVRYLDDHHGDGRLAVWCVARAGAQHAYVADDPERFFVPAYVGHLGWIGVRLDRGLAWREIEIAMGEAYRTVATKALLAELDASAPR